MLKWIAKHKFIADQGINFTSQFMAIGSNVLLMVVAEDHLKQWTGIHDMRIIVTLFAAGYLGFVWGVGYILYRTKFLESYYSSGNQMNDILVRIEKFMKAHENCS